VSLSRFLLGLVLLTLAMWVLGYVTNPIPSAFKIPSSGNIGLATGKAIGGAFWGLIVWGIIRLKVGADKAPDILKFTFNSAAIVAAIGALLMLLKLIPGVSENQIDRTSFSAGAEKTCLSSMREPFEAAGLDASKLNEFCSCYSTAVGEKVTTDEYEYLIANQAPSASYQKTISEVTEKCGQQMQ